jgi:hypothetical protein
LRQTLAHREEEEEKESVGWGCRGVGCCLSGVVVTLVIDRASNCFNLPTGGNDLHLPGVVVVVVPAVKRVSSQSSNEGERNYHLM